MAVPRSTFILLLLTSIWTLSVATKTTIKSDIGSKKILVLLPIAAPSHHNIFSALCQELLNRGHEVTIVSARLQKEKHPLLREIRVKDPLETFMVTMSKERLASPRNIWSNTLHMFQVGPLLNGAIFESPDAMALKNEKFDLVITQAYFFQEPLLAFAHHFGCPSMVLNPIGYMHHMNYFTGGAVNPAYVPNVFGDGLIPKTLFDRFYNTITSLFWMLNYQLKYISEADVLMRKAFPDAPPIQELIKNISLVLMNNNNALMYPVPLAPSVIEVAGLHIKPGKPLNADLKKWIDESKEGIVYFSLGSHLKPGFLPDEKKEAIFKSFGKLKQRVLVKWNAEIPPDPPKNCRFEEWVPQQEVLAHPNLKVFVTHGGLLSTQESLYFGAALVAIPIFGDQPMNARFATEKGFAVTVGIQDCTTENLDAALAEVINNPKYRLTSKELSLRFRLDPMNSLEKAVYYTEQLMKLGDFKHLRPSSVDLDWYQYTLLDVLLVIVVCLYVLYRVVRCICSILLGCCCKSSKAKRD